MKNMKERQIDEHLGEIDLGEYECLSDPDISDAVEFTRGLRFDEIMDLFWEAECQQCTNPLYGRYYHFYDDFEDILNNRYKSDGLSKVSYIDHGEILIVKKHNPLMNTYTIFDKFIENDKTGYLIIGNCIEEDNVKLVIDSYVERTNRYSIHKNFKINNVRVCWSNYERQCR